MLFIADTHSHIYPGFSLDLFFSSALRNLSALSAGRSELRQAMPVICLTERADCAFFKNLSDSTYRVPGLEIAARFSDRAVLCKYSGVEMLIVGGRQFRTLEKLEVLAIGRAVPPKDNLPLLETIRYAESEGAVPAIPWGFGKWLGARLTLIEAAVSTLGKSVLLSDSSMRPSLWPLPKFARLFNGSTLAGTDPLPLRNEETRVGTLASTLDSGSFEGGIYEKFMFALRNPESKPRTIGDRLSAVSTAKKALQLGLA